MTGPRLPRLAVALDAPSLEPLEPIIDALDGLPVAAKVGLSLFCAVGPAVVHHLHQARLPVFLDLKLHDIPHQVALAVRAVARLDVALLTVHASGGSAMLRAAAEAAGDRTRLLAVSVLTSLEQADLDADGHAWTTAETVARRCRLAHACGMHGAVLSARELALVDELPAEFLRVTPGIRSAAAAPDDQRRTLSAGEAIAAGASMLVVGRPILQAADPRAATVAVLEEIADALRRRSGGKDATTA
ncbi:MAG: orotidine-5'-phosphate decarboxylase [Deltaproteobacteria bacterium]|nr:orotidine-5'-phosphate decarboxylase [Deltaproteobacteria bacterium]